MPRFPISGERAALNGFLDQQREALLRTVEGVSETDARRAPTASSLTLLGLVKHSALWEERWFQGVLAGLPLPDGWPREPTVPDEDFVLEDGDTLERWTAHYRAATEASRDVAAARELDEPCVRTDLMNGNLRWVLLHLIEETARHAGHADIIREAIDGTRAT